VELLRSDQQLTRPKRSHSLWHSAGVRLHLLPRGVLDLTDPVPPHVDRIDELVVELRHTYLSTVESLAMLVEAKDATTGHHLERCRTHATALARLVDPSLATDEVQHGYLLHDIGKMGIPGKILTKPSRLSSREMSIMRRHPGLGVRMVSPMQVLDPRAVDVIHHHHERFDGTGYPSGLRGDAIPLAARIFSVVDAFDSMINDRPYRRALPIDRAVHELLAGAGTQFDPEIVAVFVGLVSGLAEPLATTTP
jgi:ribonuclease P protein subunit RPR2